MPAVYLQAFGKALLVARISCRAAALALISYVILPQCVAAKLKLHQHNIAGSYLTHDSQVLQSLARRTPGTYWIDGYRMSISQRTEICWHHASLQFDAVLNSDGQPVGELNAASPCESAPPITLGGSAWLQYTGLQKYLLVTYNPEMNVVATRIDVWRNGNNGNQMQAAPKQTWRTLCASASPHQLLYPNEGPIEVVCDAKVNTYIESVFSALLKPAAIKADSPTANQAMPSFYVVKPFEVRHNYDFEAIDGFLGDMVIAVYGHPVYERPHAHSTVREIVYAPDGTVLIADTALAHFRNEAQCAAVLSYSLAATGQDLSARLFRVQRFKVKSWSSNKNGGNNITYTGKFILNLNEQVLRLGIRQMYTAGYDIREAPFAWAVELGKRIKTPIAEPGQPLPSTLEIDDISPLYASYAFNYISQYYPGVDYSKLKRGRREYQQFLVELRKADARAFAPQPKK